MKIDVHIHYTPPSMAANLEEFSEREPFWGLLTTPSKFNHTEQGWATFERTIDDMDKAGIDKVVMLGVYSQTLERCIESNNDTIAFVRKYPNRAIGFAVVEPRPLDKALDELKRCLDGGLTGVGELGPYGMGLSFEDPGFLKIIEACVDYNIPVNLHVNEEIGHYYLGKTPYSLGQYYRFACRFPELRLIMAHYGGGLLFYETMPDVRKNLKNVYYDTAGSPLLYPTKTIYKAVLSCISHKKLLFGSDYPLIICPKKQKGPDFRPFMEEIKELGLNKVVYDDYMGNNAARFFGFMEEEKTVQKIASELPKAKSAIITEVERTEDFEVEEQMAVSAVANTYPETREVFEKYKIPWNYSPVPYWEPIMQSAAARGLGPKIRRKLLEDLNRAIKG